MSPAFLVYGVVNRLGRWFVQLRNVVKMILQRVVSYLNLLCPTKRTMHVRFFPVIALLLYSGMLWAQTSRSAYVGQSVTFAAPNPPSGAAINATAWGCRGGDVSLNQSTYSCTAKINSYYTGSAEIQCDYYYYWYDNYGYMHSNHSTTYFYLSCKAVECRLSTNSMTLSTGESKQLSYSLSPSISPTPRVRFLSSNYRVADVSDNGVVMAVGPGQCTITAENSAGPNATCSVYVRNVDPTRVSLSSPSPIHIGQTVTLVPELYPDNAQTSFTWSSSNTSVATVNGSGAVTGKSEGTARITVRTGNNLSASCEVSVYKPVPSSISLNKSSLHLSVGSSETLTYSVSPSYAIYSVSWESDAPSVVSVSNGRIEAKSSGVANITVRTDNGKTSTCRVTVPPEPTAVTLTPAELELIVGRKKQLSYTFTPSDAATRSLTWQSRDPKVASVSSSGEVTALRPGQTTVTLTTNNGVVGKCEVVVPIPLFQLFVWTKKGIKTGYLSTDEPEFSLEDKIVHFRTKHLTLNIHSDTLDRFTLEQVLPEHPRTITMPESLRMGLGTSEQLVPSFTPVDAQTTLTWFNDAPEVVSVSPSGRVTALQVGTSQLMAQTSNGLRARCRVTVPEPRLRFYVWLRNGAVHGFDLDERPEVKLDETVFTLMMGSTRVDYVAADVARFTLQDAAVSDPETGIAQPQQVQSSRPHFNNGILTIEDAEPNMPVNVYDTAGHLVLNQSADARGNLLLPLTPLRAGVYIISTGKITFKIQKR